MSDNILDSIWIEKYRPKTIQDVVLPNEYKYDFDKMIQTKEIGHLLLWGSPGSGKTTLARILCSKNILVKDKRANILEINGSAKKSRNIGYVDSVIEPFLSIPPMFGDKYKIIFIDEFDNMTTDAFRSLRGIIEKFQTSYGRFIVTCNYIDKIPDNLQSRFTPYKFKQIPKEFVLDYCSKILKLESIEFQENDLKSLIDEIYPDIRLILNIMQKESKSGKLRLTKDSLMTQEKLVIANIMEIISKLQSNQDNLVGKNINEIIEIIKKGGIDYRIIYHELFFNIKIPIIAKIIINEYSIKHNESYTSEMHFSAMIFKIIKAIQDYKLMKNKK